MRPYLTRIGFDGLVLRMMTLEPSREAATDLNDFCLFVSLLRGTYIMKRPVKPLGKVRSESV